LLLSQLLRAPLGSRLVRTDFDDDTLTLGIATTNPSTFCLDCGHETWRVHSRYTRYLEVLSNFVDGEFQAAWDCFTPSTKVTPAITSLKSVDPFNARQLLDALSISLNTIVRHAVRLPLPFVLA
jgi:hypothetical protein